MDEKTKTAEAELYLAPPDAAEETETVWEQEDRATAPKDREPGEPELRLQEKPKKAAVLTERVEQRGENRKVFPMSDGTERAVFYAGTAHVYDEETSRFEEVDNTLELDADGRHYHNRKGSFTAKFSCEEEDDTLYTVEQGMHRITVSAKKNKNQRNRGVVPKLRKKAGEAAAETLVYEEVNAGSDMEYTVTASGVKENIVVKEKLPVYRYPFLLRCENVTAEYDEEKKRVAFLSNETGNEVFYISAPYMTDANDAISAAVTYEMKDNGNGDVILNVVADSAWMNAEDRAFPVVIDPQIQVSGSSAMTTYSWNAGSISNASTHTVGTTSRGNGNYDAKRMYMSFNMPALPRNPRIKKAELRFFQASSTGEHYNYSKLGLYRVEEDIITGTCTPYHNTNLIDFAKRKISDSEAEETVSYTFDITTLVDQVNKGEVSIKNLVLKMIDETVQCDNSVTLYGSSYGGSFAPQLIVTYESSYGVNTSYRTHTHSIGRFGQGSVDLQCGNLMFESEDFAWAGNRLPVTIKHLYNSSLYGYQYTANSSIKLLAADFSAMKIGNGFKLNIMQSMMSASFRHEGDAYTGYVYIGENGEETYFKKSEKHVCYNNNTQCYYLYEDVNGGDMMYDPEKRTLEQGDDTYRFDTKGRLVRISRGANNHMDITYSAANRITAVTDGAGREFWFGYSGDYLTSVTAPDETKILYTYSGDLLSTVTYPDGRKASVTYSSNKPAAVTLLDAAGKSVYKIAYTFSGDRLASVTEYGSDNSVGAKSTYSYSVASARTVVQTTEQKDTDAGETANNVIKTVYTFDDDGNIVSEYMYSEDTGNTGVDGAGSGIHPYSGDSGAGIVSNSNNLLKGHNFSSLTAWPSMPENCGEFRITSYAYESHAKFGRRVLRMQSYKEDSAENGVYQVTNTLPAGEYTFSTYLRAVSAFTGSDAPGVFIRVTDTSGTVLGESEHLAAKDSEYARLIVPFTLASARSVQVQILANGKGTAYADGAQLENNPYANGYNMLENGNFEGSSGWDCSSGVSYTGSDRFNMSRSLMMTGDMESDRYAYQNVAVKQTRTTRETFTLSGWAKGYGLPNHARDDVTTPPQFRLRAVVYYNDSSYKDYGTETFTADFSPCTEEWQFASVQFSKSKGRTVDYVRVYCDYGNNVGTVYFDDIQLVRNSIEFNADFPEGGTGEGTGESATENKNTAPAFKEATDKFGNALTETTFTDGEFGTIYRAFVYNGDECCTEENSGNDLLKEIDARGFETGYDVDEVTSRNREVTDRCGNKTAYEYDDAGRTTKVTSKNAAGTAIANVSYSYDAFDNLTQIARGDGMKYALAYNQFHNLESIGVDGKDQKLVQYAYKAGNGRLKGITYANGDRMQASYNSAGQMVAEKWYNKNSTCTAHYKYVYDGQGNIVRSIDIGAEREYNYEYEEGRVVRATESAIELSGEIVTAKSVVSTVRYYYDTEGKLIRKVIAPTGGEAHTVYYTNTDDSNTTVKFSAGGRTVTSHSKNDSFGRKAFDELQLGTDFVSRQFVYHAGEVTQAHKDKAKVKSSATTQLVSQIILSNGTTLSYSYDGEERITSVTETYTVDEQTVTNTTTYTYDALGQLLTETVNGTAVNTMTYDSYGNIKSKNGKAYTYGDGSWKDLLTSCNGQAITYDAQGNPLTYLGHTLTWEKGRQLKSFDSNTYTYNANGIRTSKTVGGVKHTYILDGTKILREEWNGNTLIPLYDNEDSVCGILYNQEPFYFQKNLQGDIIAIVDKNAETVARYTYDAWGVPTVTQDTSACHIATINPYRYRGYYYDTETGLYYVSSRYYDPEIGRWISEDEISTLRIYQGALQQYNIFMYCFNDPVNNVDIWGYFSFKAVMVAGIASGIWCFGKYTVKNFCNFKLKTAFKEFAVGFLTGAILAALAQLPKAIAGGVFGAVVEVIKYVGQCIGGGKKLSAGTLLQKALVGFSMGIFSNAVKVLVGKLGFSYKKLTGGGVTIWSVAYAFIQGIANGHLTKFFSV